VGGGGLVAKDFAIDLLAIEHTSHEFALTLFFFIFIFHFLCHFVVVVVVVVAAVAVVAEEVVDDGVAEANKSLVAEMPVKIATVVVVEVVVVEEVVVVVDPTVLDVLGVGAIIPDFKEVAVVVVTVVVIVAVVSVVAAVVAAVVAITPLGKQWKKGRSRRGHGTQKRYMLKVFGFGELSWRKLVKI